MHKRATMHWFWVTYRTLEFINLLWDVHMIASEHHRPTPPFNAESDARNSVQRVSEVKRRTLKFQRLSDYCWAMSVAVP